MGGEPVVESLKSENPRSENTCLMMSFGVIWGKILQSEQRVSSHSQGLQHHLIDGQILFRSPPARFGHDAVEIALLSVLGVELDRRAEAERGGKVDIGLGADRLDADLEQFAQALDAAEARQSQHIRAERRGELALLRILGDGKGVRHRVLGIGSSGRFAMIAEFRAASMGWQGRSGSAESEITVKMS